MFNIGDIVTAIPKFDKKPQCAMVWSVDSRDRCYCLNFTRRGQEAWFEPNELTLVSTSTIKLRRW